MSQNLSNNKLIALQKLSKGKDLIIQKSDKGNFVVILDRQDCVKKMNNIYQTKFTIVNLKDDILLNFAVNQEKHVDMVLRKNLSNLTV